MNDGADTDLEEECDFHSCAQILKLEIHSHCKSFSHPYDWTRRNIFGKIYENYAVMIRIE